MKLKAVVDKKNEESELKGYVEEQALKARKLMDEKFREHLLEMYNSEHMLAYLSRELEIPL